MHHRHRNVLRRQCSEVRRIIAVLRLVFDNALLDSDSLSYGKASLYSDRDGAIGVLQLSLDDIVDQETANDCQQHQDTAGDAEGLQAAAA